LQTVYVLAADSPPKVITLMEESRMQNLKCFDVAGLPEGIAQLRELGPRLIAVGPETNKLRIA